MYLSGDGTLYVVRITWTRWGTAAAIGKGTAKANDCTPDCAEGTFRAHLATITVSDPRAWRGNLAYTSVSVSVPATKYSYTFTRGLIPGAAPSTTPLSAPPSPSSTAAALFSSSCTLGFDNNGILEANTAANWNVYSNSSAEEVTLTNVGGVGVSLDGFKTETTWHGQVVDTHDISPGVVPSLPEFLTPGQVYSAVIDFNSLSSIVSVTQSTYLHSKCSVVTWYRP
jgi:archaellum component FlaF (FlaF/FlaG flagellin family)